MASGWRNKRLLRECCYCRLAYSWHTGDICRNFTNRTRLERMICTDIPSPPLLDHAHTPPPDTATSLSPLAVHSILRPRRNVQHLHRAQPGVLLPARRSPCQCPYRTCVASRGLRSVSIVSGAVCAGRPQRRTRGSRRMEALSTSEEMPSLTSSSGSSSHAGGAKCSPVSPFGSACTGRG